MIRKVTCLSETELLNHLSAIKDAELLYERGIYPQSSYIFRHALTRDVVYASILERRRKELHGQIGGAIEELFKHDLAEHYEILSEHFSRGEDYARAADYSKRAARKAEKSASMPDAIAHAKKRVVCLDKLSSAGGAERELIDARTVLGLYLNQVNHFLEAKHAVEPVAQLAREKGYKRRLGQIQTVMGCYYGFGEEDFSNAFNALEEAFQIASEEKDIITLILASLWLGVFQAFNCDFERARKSIQRTVDINTSANSLWGIASMKGQLAYFGHYWAGKINSLANLSSKALKMAQESGDPISTGVTHTAYGIACYAKGRLEDAEKHLLEGQSICDRINLQGWATIACTCLAETYFKMREYDKSRRYYAQSLQRNEIGQVFPSWKGWAQLGMAKCRAMLGEKDINLEALHDIRGKNRIKVLDGWTCIYLAGVLLNLGGNKIAESEHWMQKAIEVDARNGMRFHLGLDHALYGEFFKQQGERSKSQEEFGKAVEIMEECGADGWVKRYEEELASIA